MRGPIHSPLRVLVVDDNVDTAETLVMLLQLHGHDTCVAHTGHAAITAAHQFRPDLILLDIGLPGIDGFDVARHLRGQAEFADTFIVAASGFGRERDRRRAAEVGINMYLVKPYDPWLLEPILAAARHRVAIPA
jgi:two-component system CheB/CheR fusion protein